MENTLGYYGKGSTVTLRLEKKGQDFASREKSYVFVLKTYLVLLQLKVSLLKI